MKEQLANNRQPVSKRLFCAPARPLCAGRDKGLVLVVGLMFIMILAAVGSIAYITTSGDLFVSRNYRQLNEAMSFAEAGLAEAKARVQLARTEDLYAGDPAVPIDPWWSSYIVADNKFSLAKDPLYSSAYKNYFPVVGNHTNTAFTINSLESNMDYAVKIRYKTEYDAELAGHNPSRPHYLDMDGNSGTHTAANPGSIIYFGYGNPANGGQLTQFTTNAATSFKPVQRAVAWGRSGETVYEVEMEFVAFPGPPILGAIYAKADVTGNGTSLIVDGRDQCGMENDKPPIYTKDPAITNLNGQPSTPGNPPWPVTGPDNVDIAGYVASLRGEADIIITSDINNAVYGSPTNYVIVYSNTSNPYNVNGLTLNNVTGYGILIVDGDLILGGGFRWYGLVIATGTMVFNGGGLGINISGATLANQTV
ncbi:MAG: pilus assembly PilX N-terminal domain-containing protein, partial [Desulfatibacillaceae bacterium]|nr:pilus assembly PilX N-terminal domain-containing protein [Desulfatibacillaceae bacterium]